MRAYDAIKKMTDEAGLKMPNLIRTSNMRKYMATMVQVSEVRFLQKPCLRSCLCINFLSRKAKVLSVLLWMVYEDTGILHLFL